MALSVLYRSVSRVPAGAGRLLFLPEPARGQFDSQKETPERGTLRGLARNPAFWTVTLGMAAERSRWAACRCGCRRFCRRSRGYSLESANLIFGKIVVVDGILASLAGGWLGDQLLPRMKGSYYFVSAVSMGLGVPVMIVALFNKGPFMVPGHRRGGVSASAEYVASERRAGQLRRCPHSRHRHRGQYLHVPSSRGRAFTDADGHMSPTGIRCRLRSSCRSSPWQFHLPYCFTACDSLPYANWSTNEDQPGAAGAPAG